MMTASTRKERRKHARAIRAQELVIFQWDRPGGQATATRGTLQNVSVGGIAVDVKQEMPPVGVEGTVTIHFQVVQVSSPAVVVRTWEGGMALEFLDVIPQEQITADSAE